MNIPGSHLVFTPSLTGPHSSILDLAVLLLTQPGQTPHKSGVIACNSITETLYATYSPQHDLLLRNPEKIMPGLAMRYPLQWTTQLCLPAVH